MDIGVQSGRGQLIVFLFCSNLVAIAERKVPSGYWKIKKLINLISMKSARGQAMLFLFCSNLVAIGREEGSWWLLENDKNSSI